MGENTFSLNNEQSSIGTDELRITDTLKMDAVTSAKWGKFFGIVAIVCSIILLIVAILMMFGSSLMTSGYGAMGSDYGEFSGAVGVIIGFVYLILAVVSFILGLMLFNACSSIGKGMEMASQTMLSKGMHKLKLFLQIYGIITIVCLAFALISLIGACAGAMTM